jgi:hypothetical protein
MQRRRMGQRTKCMSLYLVIAKIFNFDLQELVDLADEVKKRSGDDACLNLWLNPQ